MLATLQQADQEYATNVGEARRDCAWILSDRDVWYPNPYYTGPAVPHPEDHHDDEEEIMEVVYLKLSRFKDAAKYPQFVYGFSAKGGGYWDKLFWLMNAR